MDTSTIKIMRPALNRKKDLKKDLWGLFEIVFSIIKSLDPCGSRVQQSLLFFFKVFQIYLFFFDLRNVEVFLKSFNA